jgi:hypothetical protein
MITLPSAAEPLLMSFCVAFTAPTFQRFLVLVVGAIVTVGRHTVTGILRTLRQAAGGHFSCYHRFFSRASWSLWPLGKLLCQAVLDRLPLDQPVVVPLDDTTAQHRGKHIYGKGCHHDAVRSTHTHVVWRWGHRWVVLAISMRFPFTSRRWALPVLAALYRPEDLNRAERRRHKSAPHLARQLMAVLMHWFPQRRFVFLGDGGYASHELARFCHRHRRHATLVSRFWSDANLYAPPPAVRGPTGRPRTKGVKLPAPEATVASRRATPANVAWYGGRDRRVELTSGTGLWYKGGDGLVPVRWVYVHDVQGTHRDDYVYTTDPDLTPTQIVSFFTGRWPIETTFQELRAHLGFESPRQRVARSVLRMGPCLLGLFSVICLIYAEQLRSRRVAVASTSWYTKREPTFSDAIASVRRLLWSETLLKQAWHTEGLSKLPPRWRHVLLDCLSRAA